jgi:hypothetical protein
MVKAARGANFVGIESRGPCALKAVYIYGHYDASMIPIGWQTEQGDTWIPLGSDHTTALHVFKYYSGSGSGSGAGSDSHEIFATKAVLSTLSTPSKIRFLLKLPQEISGDSGVVGAVSTFDVTGVTNLDPPASGIVAFSAFGMLT